MSIIDVIKIVTGVIDDFILCNLTMKEFEVV